MIGSTVWRRDINSRVYRQDARGRGYGAPLARGYWREALITGETRLSWVTSAGDKIPKGGRHDGGVWALTPEELEDRIYEAENRHRIADRIRRAGLSAGQLRAVAEIIGYVPEADSAP